MPRRRVALAFTAVLATATLLAGCSSPAPQPSATTTGDAAVTLTDETRATLQKLFDDGVAASGMPGAGSPSGGSRRVGALRLGRAGFMR